MGRNQCSYLRIIYFTVNLQYTDWAMSFQGGDTHTKTGAASTCRRRYNTIDGNEFQISTEELHWPDSWCRSIRSSRGAQRCCNGQTLPLGGDTWTPPRPASSAHFNLVSAQTVSKGVMWQQEFSFCLEALLPYKQSSLFHPVSGISTGSQQVQNRLHVIVLTGLHQRRPVIIVAYVQVCARLTPNDTRIRFE